MTEYTLQAAGTAVEIIAEYPSTKEYCSEYLVEEAADVSVIVNSQDIAFERTQAAREDAIEGLPIRNLSDAMLEITAVQRKIAEHLFAYDTIVFHGSCVAVDGEGYLFTAKSGTGKSTHTRLWREVFGDKAVMVNDDKPFLKIGEESVTVYGSPWTGKHGLGCNMSAPLKAICILERGEENKISRIDPASALMMLFQQSSRPGNPQMMPKYMDLIDRLSKNVAFYRLECNMEPEAAFTSYNAMSRKEI